VFIIVLLMASVQGASFILR